jgi:hypothetical protein
MIDFKISRGLAYIAGYPFILAKDTTFRNQNDFPEPDSPEIAGDNLVYLSAWLKTVNYIEDSLIREPLLGGADTCLRARLVGQVMAISARDIDNCEKATEYLENIYPENPATLTAKIDYSGRQIPLSFGEIEPGGGYHVQNLHMRVEMHRGAVSNGGFIDGIKWSDENCATVVPIHNVHNPNTVLVEEPEAVSGSSLNRGDLVEISNIITDLHRQGGQLARIVDIKDIDEGHLVELDSAIHPLLTRLRIGARSGSKIGLTPRLKRWSGFTSPVLPEKPINLGRGIKVIFHTPGKDLEIVPGDYWTFAIRDRDYNKKYFPQKSSPDGVRIYRYPLAIIKRTGKKEFGDIIDCRKLYKPLASLRLR